MPDIQLPKVIFGTSGLGNLVTVEFARIAGSKVIAMDMNEARLILSRPAES